VVRGGELGIIGEVIDELIATKVQNPNRMPGQVRNMCHHYLRKPFLSWKYMVEEDHMTFEVKSGFKACSDPKFQEHFFRGYDYTHTQYLCIILDLKSDGDPEFSPSPLSSARPQASQLRNRNT
jgi:hypothetical protein